MPEAWRGAVDVILREERVPGAAVAVWRAGGRHLHAFGTTRVTGGTPVGPDTGFQLCSITKPFVATLAALLEADGLVCLDDRVAGLVPELAFSPSWLNDEITYRDLLSNRLGLARGGFADFGLRADHGYEELVRRFCHMPRLAPFRTRFTYLNPAFATVALALSRRAGLDFPALMRSRLLDPAGMAATTVGPEGLERPGTASAHVMAEKGPTAVLEMDDWVRPGGGGMASTAADMLTWLEILLTDGAVGGRRVLPAGLAARLWHPHIILDAGDLAPHRAAPGTPFCAYGLGWFIGQYFGQRLVCHNGSGIGWRTFLALLPEAGIGVAVLTNTAVYAPGAAVQNTLLDLCLQRPARGWLATARSFWADKQKKARDDLERGFPQSGAPPLAAAALAGTYANAHSGRLAVTADPVPTLTFEDGSCYDGHLRALGGAVFELHLHGPMAALDAPGHPPPRVRFECRDGLAGAVEVAGVGRFLRV